MAAKSKTPVKLKPVDGRQDEKRVINVIKKIPVISKNQQVSKPIAANTAEFTRLIVGDFTRDFFQQTSRLFRIFISSTFSDFKVERNEFYRRVFPSIKQQCAQLGYEFQVVDMRWGVSDTADNDHTADVMCMDEIDRCIDLSAGLNFIYLIGNRYGYMYVPIDIDEDEFEAILTVANEANIPNTDLLKKWFQLDKNSSPAKYVYVPITTHFKHFEEKSMEQQQEKQQWQIEEKSLLKALREAVDLAYQKKKISNQQATIYFQSITEREIRRATTEKNRSNLIGIVRDFSNPIIETGVDEKFFDSVRNQRIVNSMNQLKTYCAKITPVKQFRNFTVPWKSGGLDIREEASHRQYIDELCTFLTSTIMTSVENTCRIMLNKTLSTFHEDLIHHAKFAQEKTKFFFGREELLESVHSRIELNRRNTSTPIAFIAESGCGKTSFMARLAKELRIWYPESAVFIRFLGTSAPSTSIELVIRSLCTQLTTLYGHDDDDDDDDGKNSNSNDGDEDNESSTFSSLVRIFHDKLKLVSKKRLKIIRKKVRPKPLFILLDAIDQLDDTSKYSFQFDSWLLRFLPRDVHIFISFIPTIEHFNIKDLFLQFMRNDDSTLFTVPRLRPNDCEDIIRSSLQAYNRQLTSEQYIYLLTTVEQNPKPLYLKLLIDIARRWTYFPKQSTQTTLSLPETIEDAVEQLFSRLENRHGKEFVQYSLAYLVYGLNGISEIELEDCLSINDIVLNEIYAHHDPPIPNTIHVPSLLCQSLLYSIKEYLSRKRIHDKHILSFYHRKFSESTGKRYKHLREQCHEHLIEIYSNDQPSYKRTIVLKQRNNKIIDDADRLINSQITNKLNKRKLVALPYHCLEFGTEKDHLLRSICLFNLNFLSCQLQSLGHTTFLDSIRYCLRLRPNWIDLKRLYRAVWSIDDESIKDVDVSLILSEQILGFIDDYHTSQLYDELNDSDENNDLEKLLIDCRKYCDEHDNSFRSVYAGFPQETGALAWSFSPITHVLFLNEFYTLVVLDGHQDDDKNHFIETHTVAMINMQTGKVDKIFLDKDFNKIWNGYITKNGNKIYLFGVEGVKTFNSRTGDMLSEKTLSWDNKSFCNKAYCMTTNDEYLVVANEWRIIALDEVDEGSIYRSGRIPIKAVSLQIENSADVDVCVKAVGANDDYILCLIFDENDHVLISLWSLHEHDEILPMRFTLIYHNKSSLNLFDLPANNSEHLYIASTDGDFRMLDLLKIKPKTKVLALSTDDTAQQSNVLQNKQLDRLVCLSDDMIAISTIEHINFLDRKNLSVILKRIDLNETLFNWHMINQDDNNKIVITIDSSQTFITMYRQEKNDLSTLNPMKISFRSNVQYIQLIQTTTIMDNDEKKRAYILILLDDKTIQLLDTNKLSQTSLQPKGLFTRIKNYNISNTCISACEYDLNCPLVMQSSNNRTLTSELLYSFKNMNIEHITMLNNGQYYVVVNSEYIVYIYSLHNLDRSIFEYNLKIKSQSKFFSFQTYDSNIIIFMFIDQFIVLQLKFYDIENIFRVQWEQILSIPIRDAEYSLEFTPTKRFLILKQSLNLEDDPNLNDFRIFSCDSQFKISPITEPITYIKSKIASKGKITAFMRYVSLYTRPVLWIAYHGTILHVRLPSYLAELEIRSDYHSWMRHSLAIYGKTTEKSSLSITITSLAVKLPSDSCVASGADDGSIILWHLTGKCTHDVLDSIHMDTITCLKFDINTSRLFSSSLDRTIAIWSPITLLHVLRVHIPIERIDLFSISNILLARGKFWGFARLMMFYIGNYLQQSPSIQQNSTKKIFQNVPSAQACDVASWAL